MIPEDKKQEIIAALREQARARFLDQDRRARDTAIFIGPEHLMDYRKMNLKDWTNWQN